MKKTFLKILYQSTIHVSVNTTSRHRGKKQCMARHTAQWLKGLPPPITICLNWCILKDLQKASEWSQIEPTCLLFIANHWLPTRAGSLRLKMSLREPTKVTTKQLKSQSWLTSTKTIILAVPPAFAGSRHSDGGLPSSSTITNIA